MQPRALSPRKRAQHRRRRPCVASKEQEEAVLIGFEVGEIYFSRICQEGIFLRSGQRNEFCKCEEKKAILHYCSSVIIQCIYNEMLQLVTYTTARVSSARLSQGPLTSMVPCTPPCFNRWNKADHGEPRYFSKSKCYA